MPCYLCQRNVKDIDYKDTELLRKFLSGLAKIRARKKTGACASHQRKIARAIKRARHLGLIPHTPK
ncbi:MAG: 30S ribosomal protein S18 [Candidatus Wildermuthbacteria bacterium]|nr:30S ribosomal protein S18 [Candidatus Wildermuthbacteria bacterium]